MIIKFQERDNWVIFGEIDHVEYGELKDEENVAYPCGILHYEPPNLPAIGKHWQLSFFTKNMSDATVIHAYSPIYLMNDNGRTVETIY